MHTGHWIATTCPRPRGGNWLRSIPLCSSHRPPDWRSAMCPSSPDKNRRNESKSNREHQEPICRHFQNRNHIKFMKQKSETVAEDSGQRSAEHCSARIEDFSSRLTLFSDGAGSSLLVGEDVQCTITRQR